MFSTSVRPPLNDLLQSYIWILENVSSPNCALGLFRISGFTFSLVRNLTVMRCTTTEGTSCSLYVTTSDIKQVDTQWYVVTVVGISSLSTSKVVFISRGYLCYLEKKSPVCTWTAHVISSTFFLAKCKIQALWSREAS